MTVQNLLFRAHSLCMSYVTNTFLLVRSSVRSKQLLCFVHGHGNVPPYLNLLITQPTEGKEGLLSSKHITAKSLLIGSESESITSNFIIYKP